MYLWAYQNGKTNNAMTRSTLTAQLIADFQKIEKGSRFYAQDLADYRKHVAKLSMEQLNRCVNNNRYMACPIAKRNDQRAIDKMVNAPGFMNMKAA